MKRVGGLYPYITHINNIKIANNKAKKGKRNRKEIARFVENEDEKLHEIQDILISQTFKSSEYKTFNIVDKGKEREIADLPYFPDRIVHWAIMNHIEKIFIKQFISTTYAAIPKRGTHTALKKLNTDILRNPNLKYCLKLDIKKFFPNIDKEILKQLFRRKFKDVGVLWLLDEIVDGYPESGIPIGNYTSQYFGNYYLSYFDWWMKQEKKCKVYVRYMDDIIILGETKEELWELLEDIRVYLDKHLNLRVKENFQVFSIESRGVDFVGYKSYGYKITLRNETKRRMIRKTNKIRKKNYINRRDEAVINSYKGIVGHITGKRLYNNHLKDLVERVEKQRRIKREE